MGSTAQQRKLEELNARLQAAERRAQQAERAAHLAEADASDKDKELSESLSRIRLYESVSEPNASHPDTVSIKTWLIVRCQ